MSYHLANITFEDGQPDGFLPAPIIKIEARGAHDVGRLIECLAHGNSEQAGIAFKLAKRLRRTKAGRSTLRYLQSHGGGDWIGSVAE